MSLSPKLCQSHFMRQKWRSYGLFGTVGAPRQAELTNSTSSSLTLSGCSCWTQWPCAGYLVHPSEKLVGF